MRSLVATVLSLCWILHCCAPGAASDQQRHACAHGQSKIKLTPGVRLSAETGHALRRQATDYRPIRFSNFYDTATIPSTDANVRQMIEDVVPAVLDFFSEFVSVIPTESPILLDRDCSAGGGYFPPEEGSNVRRCANMCAQTTCGEVVIPQDHLKRCVECRNTDPLECALGTPSTDGPGIPNTDFIVYVSAMPCVGTQTLASAAACQMESDLDRPIAGNINFCRNNLKNTNRDFLFQVTKHELMHALGFSSSLIPFWRFSNGQPRTPRDGNGLPPTNEQGDGYRSNSLTDLTYNEWNTVSGPISHTVTLLTTEAVTREGRAHFGCNDLNGIELENQGLGGTMLQHWEKRALGNEAMTGVFDFNPTFSRLTLAVLEDSGWYSVDYSAAETLLWGRGRGCQFLQNGCGDLLDEEPFCGKDIGDRSLGCTLDRGSVATCNLVDLSDLEEDVPAEYRYLPGGVGGSLNLADYCPYYREFRQASGRLTNCTDAKNQPDPSTSGPYRGEDVLGETYGPDSLCLLQGRAWQKRFGTSTLSISNYGGGCYETSCSAGEGLTVFVRGAPFKCECEGQELVVDVLVDDTTYQGSIICPSCSSVCDENLCPNPEPAPCPGSVRTFPQQTGVPTTTTTTTTGSTSPIAAPATLLTLTLVLLLAIAMAMQ